MKKIILLIFIISTTSCSILQIKNPQNVKELLPIGSILHLTKKIIIPKDRFFIYIANGNVIPLKKYNTVNIYEPHCMLYLNKEASFQRKVLVDDFKVTKIIELERSFSKLDVMNMAKIDQEKSSFVKTGFPGDDGGPSIVMYATILSLHSDKQPDVEQLVCGHWNDPFQIEPLTLEEMKSALGDLILIGKSIAA